MSDFKYEYDPKYRRTAVSNEEIQEIFGKGLRLTGKLVGGIIKLPFKVVGKVVDIIIDDNEKVNPGNTVTIDEQRKYEEHSVKSEGELAKNQNQIQSSITTQSYASQSEYLQRLKELGLQAQAKYGKQQVLHDVTTHAKLKQPEILIPAEPEAVQKQILQLEDNIRQIVQAKTEVELKQSIRALSKVKIDFIKVLSILGDDAFDDCRASRYARFAAHSYREYRDFILPENCNIIEKYDNITGLRATLYDDDGDIVCAFAGTDILDPRDWSADLSQIPGLSLQYEDALRYGTGVCSKYPDKNVIFVGHSKGGGQAAYCAYNLGKVAETFNPAGLSFLTKHVVGNVQKKAVVNAYILATDILNKGQDIFSLLIGADGNRHDIKDVNATDHGIHGIKGFLRYFGIEYEKIK